MMAPSYGGPSPYRLVETSEELGAWRTG